MTLFSLNYKQINKLISKMQKKIFFVKLSNLTEAIYIISIGI